jgi:hypothetical protein
MTRLKKGDGSMKGYSRRKTRTAVLPALFLLLCLFPFPAAAQTQTREEVETGRFGAEEPEDSGTVSEEDINAKWLRLGLRLGPSVRFYTPSDDTPYTGGDTQSVSMDLALQAGVRILSFLSVQAEAVFTWDNASLWAYQGQLSGAYISANRYTIDYSTLSLGFPLLVKLDFYPGRFKISPFFGAYCFVPLGNLKVSNSLNDEEDSLSWRSSPPLGLLGGLSGTVKMGPGAIIADLRYAADLGDLEAENEDIFRRSMISLTVGYELGFFSKKKGSKP